MSININTMPSEIIVNILQMLPFDDQLNCRLVCKKWTEQAENAKNIKAILGIQIWAELGLFPKSSDVPKTPKEFIKGAKARNRLIVLIPQGISEEKIGELMKKKFPQNKDGYKFVPTNIKNDEEYKRIVQKSYWIGITRTLIKEGEQLTYDEANEYAKKFQNKLTPICRLPKRLEISSAALLKFTQTEERLLKSERSMNKSNLSWCQEIIRLDYQNWGTAVGNFESDGITIYDLYDISGFGLFGEPVPLSKLGVFPVYEL